MYEKDCIFYWNHPVHNGNFIDDTEWLVGEGA